MIIGRTKSVCPVCLRVVDAQKRTDNDGIYLDKHCSEHGDFSALIWEGTVRSALPPPGKGMHRISASQRSKSNTII